MQNNHYYDKQFKQIDFTTRSQELGDFETCQFISCHFDAVNLSGLNFINCEFIECNLSLATLSGTSFQNVIFKNCKMIGFNLETCNPFGLKVSFEHCVLNDSSFYQLQLQKTHFKACNLENIDFGYCNLNQSYFENCNLKAAIFDQTNLEKANLISSYHFTINPTENKLKGAKFSKENCFGLLEHLAIKIE